MSPHQGKFVAYFRVSTDKQGEVPALRHDAFKPQLAGVPEYGLAVFLDVVSEPTP